MRDPRNEPLSASFDDGSARSERNAPERRCVLSGRSAARETLLRLAIGPDGQVLPDALARAPGRGAWIGATRTELEQALDNGHLRGALGRGFRGAALSISADLPEKAEIALVRAFTDRLGVEMRSGNLVTGSDRIGELARGGRVAWLGHAADAGEDGVRRLNQAWRVGSDAEGSGKAGVRLPLDRAALSVALGRDNVVHLALTDRAAAGRVTALLARLIHYLGGGDPPHGTGQQQETGTASRAA